MKKIKLGDVCKINAETYSDSNSCDFVNYLDTSNITANHIENIQHIDITQEKLPSRARRKVKFNSIIYSTVRPNQRHYGIIKSQPENFLVSTGFAVIDVDPKKIDANFLYYQLSRDEIVNNLQSIAEQSTTAYPSIKPSDLSNLKFYVPSLDTQRKIGNFLYALDDKIALNKKINATLEAMAKTLYDYWFVQFDFPDEHGRPYKSSGGKMIYSSELGRDIPEGWQIKTLKDICKIVDCLHSQKPIRMYEQERCFLLQLENLISLGIIDLGYKYYVSESDYNTWTAKIEVCEGDLIITNAGRVGAFARVPKGIKAGIGRNITAIRPERVSSVYLYYYLHSVDNLRQIRKNIDVGAFFNSLNVKGLKQISVLIPPKNLMEFFTRNCEPYRYKLELAACESQQIVALRDWLLPLLMNEQVKFKEDKNE